MSGWWQTRSWRSSSSWASFMTSFSCSLYSIGIHVPCHSSPHCALRGACLRCRIVVLVAGARLHHAVILVDFVFLELAVLLFRAVAVGPMLVAKVVIMGEKEQNPPLPSSWGSSTLASRWRGAWPFSILVRALWLCHLSGCWFSSRCTAQLWRRD